VSPTVFDVKDTSLKDKKNNKIMSKAKTLVNRIKAKNRISNIYAGERSV
jgi:hypothetical protein